MNIFKYLSRLSLNRIILWSYLIWYLVISIIYFDTDLYLWGTSFGIGIIVYAALELSTGDLSWRRIHTHYWESFRLFIIPFCVSSFSGLVKGYGFILIFSPILEEDILAIGAILLFIGIVLTIKKISG
ncbi:hypothetical protein BMS3Abin03_02149 [bacterium BMS3Abin03]|nr:hypothetical protein BMS3Abin03_02149 [bacterium BMS3Abin03]